MLTLICDRLTRKVFDDVMEVAWSTMWNVTDETAINCERFLDGRGMEYFLGCLHVSNMTRSRVKSCLPSSVLASIQNELDETPLSRTQRAHINHLFFFFYFVPPIR